MQLIKKALLPVIFFSISFNSYSDDHVQPMIVPMEHFACNYNKGKDRDDDLKVVEEWNDFLDESNVSYSGYFLDPYYTNSTIPIG